MIFYNLFQLLKNNINYNFIFINIKMSKHIILDDFLVPDNIGNKLEDFEILQTLGKGGYGIVSKVKSKINHKLYAMKMINLSLVKDPREIQLSLNEIKIIQSLNSPHIIKYYTSFQIEKRLYIIMEFMNNGDMKGYINAHQSMNKPIPENELWQLFYQCTAGLYYIHRKNLIHRDIKPANFFMTDDKAIKIGDFGISGIAKKTENLVIGTPDYMSPEMFTGGYTNKVDVYALGISFFQMCFYDSPRKIMVIKTPEGGERGEIQDFPPKHNIGLYSKEITNLINWMIERDPNKRASAFEVLNYIRKIYNQKFKQNYSIDCVYRSLFSLQNLTNYMKSNSAIINSTMNERTISNSFLYAIGKMDFYNNWPLELVNLREILTFSNPSFPDPGMIDPIDLLIFILKSFHNESIIKNINNSNNLYISTPDNTPSIINYQQTFQNYFSIFQNFKSCVSNLFCGTYEITKFCCSCKRKKFYFQNFFYVIFNIEEALKNGLTGINNALANYFLKQNTLMINYQSYCCFCKNNTFHQETKKFFNLPYNLIVCFKGEKQKYDNQYIRYGLSLNFSQLGLKSDPFIFDLKAVINCNIINENKFYTCIYLDSFKKQWFISDGYEIQPTNDPLAMNNNLGDVIMLFYSSLN